MHFTIEGNIIENKNTLNNVGKQCDKISDDNLNNFNNFDLSFMSPSNNGFLYSLSPPPTDQLQKFNLIENPSGEPKFNSNKELNVTNTQVLPVFSNTQLFNVPKLPEYNQNTNVKDYNLCINEKIEIPLQFDPLFTSNFDYST